MACISFSCSAVADAPRLCHFYQVPLLIRRLFFCSLSCIHQASFLGGRLGVFMLPFIYLFCGYVLGRFGGVTAHGTFTRTHTHAHALHMLHTHTTRMGGLLCLLWLFSIRYVGFVAWLS